METISIEQWAAECRQRIAEREDMPISTLAPRNRPMRGLDENAGDVDSGVIRSGSKGYGWLGVGVVIGFLTLAGMALVAAFGLK